MTFLRTDSATVGAFSATVPMRCNFSRTSPGSATAERNSAVIASKSRAGVDLRLGGGLAFEELRVTAGC